MKDEETVLDQNSLELEIDIVKEYSVRKPAT